MENSSLIADMLNWIGETPKPYDEVMDAWRTSCPRLSIWEDAIDNGLVSHHYSGEREHSVFVTKKGQAFLAEHMARSA